MEEKFSKAQRSAIMRSVRDRDTKPERIVRKLVYSLGYRYRLHRKDIPGKPDLAFIGKKKVIFVHGCFWHGHGCKRGSRIPKENKDYWVTKVGKNKKRDELNQVKLEKMGWNIFVVWECELSDKESLSKRIKAFLDL